VWPQAIVILLLLAATAAALVRAPLIGFAGAWFFVTLAPASSVVPIATEVGAERRMYLPLLAVVTLVVLAASSAQAAVRRSVAGRAPAGDPNHTGEGSRLRLAGAVVCVATAAALAATTIARNREYTSALTLTRTIVERRPTPVAHHMLGEQLVEAGRVDEAVRHLREAIEGGNSRAEYPLGLVELNRGNEDAAIEHLVRFVRTYGVPQVPRWLEPPLDEVLRARAALGVAYLQRREWVKAEEQARAALAVAPRYVEAHSVLAHALFGQERWAEAAAQYRIYLGARPDDVQAVLNLGVALVATERLVEALPIFRRAASLDPGNERARRLLALAEADAARGAR
jgi:tetratricopeptide (TPR) repeat protein